MKEIPDINLKLLNDIIVFFTLEGTTCIFEIQKWRFSGIYNTRPNLDGYGESFCNRKKNILLKKRIIKRDTLRIS